MSWQLRLANAQLRLLTKPMLSRVPDPVTARRHMELLARWVFRPVPGLRRRQDGTFHWISAGPVRAGQVILYFHGGAYIAGSPVTHAKMLARLSKLAGVEVLAPAYRLAPEAPFPAALEDARAAWGHLMSLGYSSQEIIIGGDSAGGSLALALLSELCQAGDPPAGLFAFSPWTDLASTGDSHRENAAKEAILPVERFGEVVDYVLQGADPKDPRISPLYADFPAPPPVLLQYSETEILRDDSRRMARRLEASGGQVTEQVAEDAPHVWQLFDGWIPEARDSLRQVAKFVQEVLSQPPQS